MMDRIIPTTATGRYLTGSILTVSLIVLFLLLPVISIVVISLRGGTDSSLHLLQTRFSSEFATTIILGTGVAVVTAILGTVTAWLTTFYQFPLRKLIAIGLMLPFAIPPYIAAYTHVEFFSFTGPVQELVREVGNFASRRDYWFPDMRSLPGAIFILSLVLYPYVYIATRALFLFRSSALTDMARVLGAGNARILFRVLIPGARPAIIIGVTLAVMETLNDIGAVEFLGVETLTFSIFSIWLNQGDLSGASQISLFLLMLSLVLVFIERKARSQRSFVEKQQGKPGGTFSRIELGKKGSIAAITTCILPIVFGFAIPVAVLVDLAIDDIAAFTDPSLLQAALSSTMLAGIGAIVAVTIGLFLTYQLRIARSSWLNGMTRIACIGYAVPGTVIAIGLLIPLAAWDNFFDAQMRGWFGFSSGLLLSGTGIIIIYAYVVRFMAIAEGNVANGFQKISPQLDAASRSLGRNARQTLREILLPLIRPALFTAAMLVFVDCMKELSATILVRPFGLTTLSTYVYDFASIARFDEAAPACLVIVMISLIPTLLLARTDPGAEVNARAR